MAEFRDASEQSRKLLAQARDKADALRRQLVLAKQGLSDSRELMARAVSAAGSPFQSASASIELAAEPRPRTGGMARTFAAVTDLIEQVELSATLDVCVAARLTEDIMLAIQSKADPSLLIGVLLEGIAQAVLERLPAAERRDTAIALCGLLWDRVGRNEPGPA